MRAFLEEYGRIIIIIVCVAALLGVVAIFKLKGISLADSSLGAFVRNANSAINELEDANAYSVKMPKSTTAEIKSSGGNLAKVKAGETITVGPGYTNSEQTITIASLSEQTPGNATAADILAGKTVWVNGVQITGTMPNKGNITGDIIKADSFPAGYYSGISVTKKGAATYVPGTTDQTIADNQFLTGVQTIKGDGNLVAANIAKGKTIFGVTGTFGSDTNAAAADVLQGKTVYINGQKVTGTLNPTNYSSDATASADKILQGWTAYVNGKKITGTIPSLLATTVTPSASDQKIAGKKYLAGDITIKGDNNLKPENIRTGVTIYSVNGTYTSDATADAKKIMAGYTAYVNGQKITGTATAADFTQDGTATAKQILSGYTAYVKGKKITGTLTVKDFTNDATATAKDVLVGKTAYGKDGKITGTLTVGDLTADATAKPEQILDGAIAYVKGQKIIGTMQSRTTYSVIGTVGNDNNGVSPGNFSIPTNIKLGIGDAASFASGYYPNGFKVENSVINRGAKNANLNAGQSVTLAAGYYTGGTIAANSLASQTQANATAAQILSGYTAWVNGSKISGSMPRNATNGYQEALSIGVDHGVNGNLFLRMPFGAYLNSASEGYPEVYVNAKKVIRECFGGYHFAENATRVGWAANSSWPDGGYGHVHFPEGYYGGNDGITNHSDWAPEIRLTKDQIKDLAKSAGITFDISSLRYNHHVHSTTTKDAYVQTTTLDVTYDGPADNYKPTTSGGCYSVVYVPAVTGGVGHSSESWGDGSWTNRQYCTNCGAELGWSGWVWDGDRGAGDMSGHEEYHDYTGSSHTCREAYYDVQLTCGHSRGQVVSVSIAN